MEIEYRRTWNQSVMLITGHVEEENYELKMLKHNTVAGLLPVEEIQENRGFPVLLRYYREKVVRVLS